MPTQTDIRSKITAEIVDSLKAGKRPWVRPWSSDPNCGSPKNAISKKPYRGINPLVLSLASDDRQYESRWWGTYRQWASIQGQVKRRPKDVRPGEWGTTIVFYKPVTKQTVNDDGEPESKSYRILKSFTVFSLDQVDGEGVKKLNEVRTLEIQRFTTPRVAVSRPRSATIRVVVRELRRGRCSKSSYQKELCSAEFFHLRG